MHFRYLVSVLILAGIGALSLANSLPALAAGPHYPAAGNSEEPVVLSFEELARLSRPRQLRYLALLRSALVGMDESLRAGGERARIVPKSNPSWADRLLDGLVCSAYAKEGVPAPGFCINLGVIRPAGEGCDLSDPHRHDFNTREDLSFLGEAGTCPKQPVPQKPCDPIFGLSPTEDKVHCVRVNSTRSCSKLSSPKDRSFVDLLMSCVAAGSQGQVPVRAGSRARVSCPGLIDHFNRNSRLLLAYCKGQQGACGLTMSKLRNVLELASTEPRLDDEAKDDDSRKSAKKELRKALARLDQELGVMNSGRLTDLAAPGCQTLLAETARKQSLRCGSRQSSMSGIKVL